MDKESIEKEERRVETSRSRTKATGDGEEVEGIIGVKEERKRREVTIGARTKARCNDKANNAHTC